MSALKASGERGGVNENTPNARFSLCQWWWGRYTGNETWAYMIMWENENMKVWAFENVMMLSWDCHEETGWNSCEKLSCSSSNGTVPPPFFFLETQPLLIHKTERGLYQKLSDTILIKASQQKCFFSKNYVSMFVFIFAMMGILVILTMTKMMLCVDVSIRDPISRR